MGWRWGWGGSEVLQRLLSILAYFPALVAPEKRLGWFFAVLGSLGIQILEASHAAQLLLPLCCCGPFRPACLLFCPRRPLGPLAATHSLAPSAGGPLQPGQTDAQLLQPGCSTHHHCTAMPPPILPTALQVCTTATTSCCRRASSHTRTRSATAWAATTCCCPSTRRAARTTTTTTTAS